jgi:hypothetical protein
MIAGGHPGYTHDAEPKERKGLKCPVEERWLVYSIPPCKL